MIGNLRNMAIDMGSELENQNRQLERINLKVNRSLAFFCKHFIYIGALINNGIQSVPKRTSGSPVNNI